MSHNDSSFTNASRKSLGTCTLVGAGPGDPELLTVKAVKAIQAATVLFVDDLVNEEVLAHARASARIVYVGKRGGCKSTPQAFIEKLMINAVHEGETVVRLKGGDPFIFGRGGEEVEHLRNVGIEVNIINGITISPKKNFCIIKIWLSKCEYNNPDIITDIDGLVRQGCLFKRHL